MTTHVDVIVAGAGLSGLAVAFGLRQRGASVDVFEAAPRVGGVIGTRHRDGALFETGPNSALDSAPAIDELLGALDLRGERLSVNPVAARRFIVRDGTLVALPMSPPALIASQAFSFAAKLRLLREPFIAPSPAGVEESIADFARRRLGPEVLDYAVDPFVSGIHAGDPERISLRGAFPRLYAMEQAHGSVLRGQLEEARRRRAQGETAKPVAKSFSFRNGMQTLTDALARSVTGVRTGTRLHELARDGDRWRVSAEQDGHPVVAHAKAVVLAVPARDAASLVSAFAPGAAASLSQIVYAPIASIAAVYRRDDIAHPLDGFGFLVPGKERRPILGTLFSSSMFEGRAPGAHALLTTFVGGRRNPERMEDTDAELAKLVHTELAALLGARNAPLWTEITRWARAIPQYEIGHLERMRALDDAERDVAGLYFCANYRDGIAIGDRIKAAGMTAEAVAQFVATRPHSI